MFLFNRLLFVFAIWPGPSGSLRDSPEWASGWCVWQYDWLCPPRGPRHQGEEVQTLCPQEQRDPRGLPRLLKLPVWWTGLFQRPEICREYDDKLSVNGSKRVMLLLSIGHFLSCFIILCSAEFYITQMVLFYIWIHLEIVVWWLRSSFWTWAGISDISYHAFETHIKGKATCIFPWQKVWYDLLL